LIILSNPEEKPTRDEHCHNSVSTNIQLQKSESPFVLTVKFAPMGHLYGTIGHLFSPSLDYDEDKVGIQINQTGRGQIWMAQSAGQVTDQSESHGINQSF